MSDIPARERDRFIEGMPAGRLHAFSPGPGLLFVPKLLRALVGRQAGRQAGRRFG